MNLEGNFTPEKTICKFRWSYPVVHISRGELRTCDKTINIKITDEMLHELGTDAFLNNSYLIERRREKLHGLRHSDCFNCIKLEDKGVVSTRTGAAVFTDYMNQYTGQQAGFESYKYSTNPLHMRADHPEILEISLSNQCNLKCIYCSPTFSTLWEDEAVKYGEMKDSEREKNFSASPLFEKYFWDWFDQIKGGLNRIIFIGGEPLIQEKIYEYLEIMNQKIRKDAALSKHRIVINIISNFNTPDHYFDRFLNILGELSENFIVHIEASIESVGPKAEYVRSGLSWRRLEKNVRKLLNLRMKNVRFGLQMAVNLLCLSTLPDLLRFASALQSEYKTLVDYKENIVVAPEYLCPLILTPDFASYLDEAISITEQELANPEKSYKAADCNEWSHQRWQLYLPFLQSIRAGILRQESTTPHLKKEFHDFIARNDQRRKSNFSEVFPEYMEFMGACAEV